VSRLLGWLSEHKNGVAAVAALLVVWRVARFALGVLTVRAVIPWLERRAR
jgi:hypothetical protein